MVRKSATGRIGIADVAVKAGVSHATVSRVMNGNYTVDPDIAARVPQTRLLALPRCGHSPHRDQPEAVQQAITAFLAPVLMGGTDTDPR